MVEINGKTILELPLEHIWHEDVETGFQSHWSDLKPIKKIRKTEARITKDGLNYDNFVFNPLSALAPDSSNQFQAIQSKEYAKEKERSHKGWSEEWDKSFEPPPITHLPRTLNLQEIEYLLRLYRLDELN